MQKDPFMSEALEEAKKALADNEVPVGAVIVKDGQVIGRGHNRRMQKNDPDAIKDTILNYFRQLKFFSNSDFGFLDVHNETLFNKNSTILIDIVEMLQDIRLKTDKHSGTLIDTSISAVKKENKLFFNKLYLFVNL